MTNARRIYESLIESPASSIVNFNSELKNIWLDATKCDFCGNTLGIYRFGIYSSSILREEDENETEYLTLINLCSNCTQHQFVPKASYDKMLYFASKKDHQLYALRLISGLTRIFEMNLPFIERPVVKKRGIIRELLIVNNLLIPCYGGDKYQSKTLPAKKEQVPVIPKFIKIYKELAIQEVTDGKSSNIRK